ncbi:cytochrome bd-I oxidase subunit CydX [Neomegalonema perideroedes]|nr:cytochrome bd-I oxidase subunit CydX [Neomegalonema perideroedes]
MWYFAWMLGLPLAAAFAVLNAMWFELMEDEAEGRLTPVPAPAPETPPDA